MTHLDFDLSTLAERIAESPDVDLVREMVTFLYQALIDVEATDAIGAERHERVLTRTTRRNGSRQRRLSTKAGDVDLKIPKLRKGSFFPSVLERRRRIDQALYAVVMEAYVHGVSTRKVDDLVQALGVDAGISKSEVSRICKEMDAELEGFRTRDFTYPFPYVFLDATYVKARVNKRVVSRAVVVAMGVSLGGNREILGLSVGDSEDKVFWVDVLRHCYCLLSVILGDAVRHRLLERSPMERIARPKVPPARPKYLSEDDVKRVLDACLATGDPRAVAVVLMAHLGLRRNEALGLIWDDLDVDSATMTVHMQLGRLPGDTTLQRRQLKTLTSRRTLPLSSALLELLTAVRREHERLGYTTPFIITMEGTGPVDPDATTRWLTTVGASIGVAVTPHRLRHTAATLMLNHGVSLEAVGKVLGHGDLKTTAVYARVLDSSSDRAVGALAAIFDR